MTHRGGNLVKRTMPAHGIGNVAAASPGLLPLFGIPELEEARRERLNLMHKLAHQRLEARTRIRIEQRLNLLVAKIMRLEMQIGGRP